MNIDASRERDIPVGKHRQIGALRHHRGSIGDEPMFQNGGLNVGNEASLHLFDFGSSPVLAPFHDKVARLVSHLHQAIDLLAGGKSAFVIDEPFLQLRQITADFNAAIVVVVTTSPTILGF